MSEGFDLFWAHYPRREKKGDARKAWERLNPSAALVQTIVEALKWQVNRPQWLKEDGQFIPLPATWLRAEQWDDEPPVDLRAQKRREGILELQAFKDEVARRRA